MSDELTNARLRELEREIAKLKTQLGYDLRSARWDAKHEDETRRKILRDLLNIVASYTKDGDDALIGDGGAA